MRWPWLSRAQAEADRAVLLARLNDRQEEVRGLREELRAMQGERLQLLDRLMALLKPQSAAIMHPPQRNVVAFPERPAPSPGFVDGGADDPYEEMPEGGIEAYLRSVSTPTPPADGTDQAS